MSIGEDPVPADRVNVVGRLIGDSNGASWSRRCHDDESRKGFFLAGCE